jgi:hypothetical protein
MSWRRLAVSRGQCFLANGETGSGIAWSPDGQYLLFDTAQRSEQVQIARVDLLPHVPKYREDEVRELFRPKTPGSPGNPTPATPCVTPAPAAPKMQEPEHTSDDKLPATSAAATEEKKKPEPVKIVFEGIRDRLTLLPLGVSADVPGD